MADSSSYTAAVSGINILLNILYNAGYMYSDIMAIINMDTSTTAAGIYYYSMAWYIGNVIIRIFWRNPTELNTEGTDT